MEQEEGSFFFSTVAFEEKICESKVSHTVSLDKRTESFFEQEVWFAQGKSKHIILYIYIYSICFLYKG